ncbi:MAG: peptidyl-prolyl cis-trans isomerase [Kiritimatiellae bacterium]|nr:peptidyl-prolyl cis-trans isomerase [Kiritimatiellia bacterium]
MFIIKFNNMVKNKWIWAAFAIVVAVAFGASDMLGAGSRAREGGGRLGSLGGKPLDPALWQTVNNLVRYRNLMGGTQDAYSARERWKLCAALLRAREAGLSVSDAELARIIHGMGFFQDADGRFSSENYNRALSRIEFTPTMFQEALRADVALNQLRFYAARGPWAPPSIVEDRTLGRSDRFTLQAATLADAFDAAETEVSEDEARAFYDAHPDLYRLPERRGVRYVAFPAVAYREKAAVSDEEVAEYYEENESDFTTKGTNDVEVLRPLDEVREEIVGILAPERQRELAATDAGDFADLFFRPGYDGAAPASDFAAEAAKLGYAVSTTALFSADEPPVSPDLADEFAANVFALETGGEVSDRVSGVIGGDGSSEFFVAELLEVSESHIPDYGEIAERVLADAREDKAARAFRDEVSRVQEALLRAVEDGGSFEAAAASNGLAVGTNFIFTARDAFGGSAPVESPHQVAQSMMQLGPGDLSPAPIAVPGGVLFFRVVAREPGDAALAGTYRDSIVYGCESQTADALWTDWLERNLVSMDPKPNTPFEGAEDAPAAGDEEAED